MVISDKNAGTRSTTSWYSLSRSLRCSATKASWSDPVAVLLLDQGTIAAKADSQARSI
jgi:hypothetical protein